MSGFIKIHRKILEWEWYTDQPTFRLFTHILLKANYKDGRYKGVSVPKGSIVAGRKALAKQTGLSEQQIRTSLNKLKSTNEITITTTNKFSVISIVNWHCYQVNNHEDNQQPTNNQPTSNQQVTTSKEVKKVKERKKESTCAIPEFIDISIWKDFIKHRGGSKFTQLMATRIINKLIEWQQSGHDANEILNTSIMNGWSGVFEPKKGNNANGATNSGTGNSPHEKMFSGFMQTDIRHDHQE